MAAEQVIAAHSPEAAGDEELVAALRSGEERTFRALFARYSPMMERVARSYVDSDAVAEDIVQETWLAIVTGIDRFEGRSGLGTWIFSILTNQAKTHHTRERRALPLSSIVTGQDDASAVDPDRFQKDDEAWPGHWATPPRPWQRPERRLLSLEAREQFKGGADSAARSPARDRDAAGHRRPLSRGSLRSARAQPGEPAGASASWAVPIARCPRSVFRRHRRVTKSWSGRHR